MFFLYCSYADILEALAQHLDARWKDFGVFLGVEHQFLATIERENGGKPRDCMLELVRRWIDNQKGTGSLPRTWQTVVKAVKDTGNGVLAENLADKHGVHLP